MRFASHAFDASDPARSIRAVTPGSSDLPDGVCKALLVTVDGNLQITAEDDSSAHTFAVTAGQLVPIRVRVVGSSTTATVLALY